MDYIKISKIYQLNQKTKDNTYLSPASNFDGFIQGELTFVRVADGNSCTIWRSMDGKLYNLTEDQIAKFVCVGSCNTN